MDCYAEIVKSPMISPPLLINIQQCLSLSPSCGRVHMVHRMGAFCTLCLCISYMNCIHICTAHKVRGAQKQNTKPYVLHVCIMSVLCTIATCTVDMNGKCSAHIIQTCVVQGMLPHAPNSAHHTHLYKVNSTSAQGLRQQHKLLKKNKQGELRPVNCPVISMLLQVIIHILQKYTSVP